MPGVPPVICAQLTLLEADHAQVPPAVTPTDPEPPDDAYDAELAERLAPVHGSLKEKLFESALMLDPPGPSAETAAL